MWPALTRSYFLSQYRSASKKQKTSLGAAASSSAVLKTTKTFHVFTTAICYATKGEDPFEMITNWSNLLLNVLRNVPREYNISFHHFCAKDGEYWLNPQQQEQFLKAIDLSVTSFLKFQEPTNWVFYEKEFPRNDNEFKQITGESIKNMEHILIDMAHLVEDAKSIPKRDIYYGSESYVGYDTQFLESINYLYLGYDVFLMGIPDNFPDLLSFDDDGNLIKHVFHIKKIFNFTMTNNDPETPEPDKLIPANEAPPDELLRNYF